MIRIRKARPVDIQALDALRRDSILSISAGIYSKPELQAWAGATRSKPLLQRIQDGCVMVAEQHHELLASNSLDLDRAEMLALFVSPRAQGSGLGRKMVAVIEKLAVQYGLLKLNVSAARSAIDFITACGYRPIGNARIEPDPRSGMLCLKMTRHFTRRQTRFGRKIAALHQRLEIPGDYGQRHRLRLQPECPDTVSIGEDVFQRLQYMAPRAAGAWLAMKNTAAAEGVALQPVSAFRPVDYQAGIINGKLAAGQDISRILRVSAAPGYSQHHTGRALDITTPGYAPLEQEFDQSPGFKWLTERARDYGYKLTFPDNNRHGVAYEPWHWCWHKG